jgi:hypothetical protein
MTNKETGGPAFPAPAGVSHITEQGMTLRDYFAAKALQGMLANAGPYDPEWAEDSPGHKHAWLIANLCYAYADEMLKARDGTT